MTLALGSLRPPRVPLRELCALTDRALGDLGKRRNQDRLSFLVGVKTPVVRHWIRYWDHMLNGSPEERRKTVFNVTKANIRDLCYDIELRGGDVSYGFVVLGAMDGRDIEGGKRGDYGVHVEWVGPAPDTWPEPVETGPQVTDAEAEERGREVMRKDPERFEEARKVLVGSDAMVKREVAAQAKRTRASRLARARIKKEHRLGPHA